MLQIEDALDDFKKAVKNIQADKKVLADAKAKDVVKNLDALNKTLEKLKDRKKKLQDFHQRDEQDQGGRKDYNDDQHSFMRIHQRYWGGRSQGARQTLRPATFQQIRRKRPSFRH